MIDNLAIAITHSLMLLTAFLLLKRADLDREGPAPRRGFRPRADDREPPRA